MKKCFIMVAILVLLLVVSASVCAASDIDYVGKDMELKDGEMGIVSIGGGDDIDATKDLSPYAYGGGLLLLVASGGVAWRLKKDK